MNELICCPICRRNDEITVYPHFARVTDSKRRASYIAYCPRCKVSTCFTTGGKVHTIYDVIFNDNPLLQKKIGSWSAGDSIFHTLMVDINTV